MRQSFYFFFFLGTFFFLALCENDFLDLDYQISFLSPNTDVTNLGDTLHIQITNESSILKDGFVLEGLDTDTQWIVEAKAWGEEEGTFEITESVEV